MMMDAMAEASPPRPAPAETEAAAQMAADGETVNVNVGVLGHVDSGKTSLVRALSTMLSTAALDKHPQSKERGITLDLGFSAFSAPLPAHLAGQCSYSKVQYTLVDCPGHASLIKTIIGGAQIIDRMILVVDVTKGVQTQTAECLVIGEILANANDLTVVLNKIDLLPEGEREAGVERVTRVVRQALEGTRFKGCPVLAVSAVVGGDGKGGVGANSAQQQAQGHETGPKPESLGLDGLVEHLRRTTVLPDRGQAATEPLYFAIDHCFPIKGKGTVLTGTVLSGQARVGDTVELPQLKLERKIKSIQMFKRPVGLAAKGDRAAVCLPNLDAKLLERGVLTTPGSVPSTHAVVALVRKVKYFPLSCPSRSKLHVTVGHSTTLCTVTLFGSSELKATAASHLGKPLPLLEWDQGAAYKYDEELQGGGKAKGGPFLHWALLEFEQPLICQAGATVIGSRLDMDVDTKSCRIAFYGRVSRQFAQPLSAEDRAKLNVFKLKERTGTVDRVKDETSVIGKGMFAKDADLERFVGKRLETADGAVGRLDSPFGKTGKFTATFPSGHKLSKGDKLLLRFRHLVFAPGATNKKILQS